jgi:hypothetical protein
VPGSCGANLTATVPLQRPSRVANLNPSSLRYQLDIASQTLPSLGDKKPTRLRSRLGIDHSQADHSLMHSFSVADYFQLPMRPCHHPFNSEYLRQSIPMHFVRLALCVTVNQHEPTQNPSIPATLKILHYLYHYARSPTSQYRSLQSREISHTTYVHQHMYFTLHDSTNLTPCLETVLP